MPLHVFAKLGTMDLDWALVEYAQWIRSKLLQGMPVVAHHAMRIQRQMELQAQPVRHHACVIRDSTAQDSVTAKHAQLEHTRHLRVTVHSHYACLAQLAKRQHRAQRDVPTRVNQGHISTAAAFATSALRIHSKPVWVI
jgi:hypothetical protein